MKRNNSTGKKKMLDQLDCQMIELLQKDGRVSNTEIAKKMGISEATVRGWSADSSARWSRAWT